MISRFWIKGFTLLESLVSLSILSVVSLILVVSFIKFDNEQLKKDKAISLIILDRYEYLLRANGDQQSEILENFGSDLGRFGLVGSSSINYDNNIEMLTLEVGVSEGESLIAQRKIILNFNEGGYEN